MKTIQHKFVDKIPEVLMQGVLYVSLEYATAVHKCTCGCENEVVTPLSPLDWKLTFNGETITLKPSIGNWNFKCRSHYWITENKIIEASTWYGKSRQNEKATVNSKKGKKKKRNRWFPKD